jgi:hypothetical protein
MCELYLAGERGQELARYRDLPRGYAVDIGGELYSEAVLHGAAASAWALAVEARLAREGLSEEVDVIFAAYKANVDGFLDWYYSLEGEAGLELAEIIEAIDPGSTGFLEDRLREALSEGVDTSGVDAAVMGLAQAAPAHRARLKALADTHRIGPAPDPGAIAWPWSEVRAEVVLSLPEGYLEGLEDPRWLAPLAGLGGVAGLGGAGAVSGGKFRESTAYGWGDALGGAVKDVVQGRVKGIAMSVARRPIFKQAAKIVVKSVALRVGGALAGAVIGAEAGAVGGTAVAPGPGTVLGTLLGAAVGVGAYFVADYLYRKLDEAINRDELRGVLMESIEDARAELQLELMGEPAPGT